MLISPVQGSAADFEAGLAAEAAVEPNAATVAAVARKATSVLPRRLRSAGVGETSEEFCMSSSSGAQQPILRLMGQLDELWTR